mgnify:CR=1 FL=1
MDEMIKYILLIGIPMALTQCLYRLIDKKGIKTRALSEKFPTLKKRKFLVQIIFPLLFVVLFGFVSILCKIPITVFFIVCGLVVGVINGLAITLMYFCEE